MASEKRELRLGEAELSRRHWLNTIATLSYDTLESTVTIASVPTPLGPMHVATVPHGLCAAVFDGRYQALEPRLRRVFGPYFNVVPGDPHDVASRLDAYFDGTFDALVDMPLAIAATPMQRRVWALVGALPALGAIIFQNIVWFTCPPPLLRTAVRMSSGTLPRFRSSSSALIPCRSARSSSAALRLFTYA